MQAEIGEDEEFVPKDVTSVGLAVQAPGGYADVEVEGVAGGGLEQVEDVEVHGQPRQAASVVHLEREAFPQIGPVTGVGMEELAEATDARAPRARLGQRLADRAVLRSEEGDNFLDGDRLEGLNGQGQLVSDEAGLLHHPAFRVRRPPRTSDPGPCCFGHPHAGLTGSGAQSNRLVVDRVDLHVNEVVVVEFAVAGDAGVDNPAVET